MIVEKTFTCSIEDINSVFVDVAEEIKKGWRVTSIEHLPLDINYDLRPKPSFKVHLMKAGE